MWLGSIFFLAECYRIQLTRALFLVINYITECNLMAPHRLFHSAQRMQPQQSRCYGLSQLWEQVTDPFPWSLSCLEMCVEWSQSEIELVCSVLLYSVFFLTHIHARTHAHTQTIFLSFFFSFSQVMFQVGWQSTVRSYKQSRKFVSCVQKHVLTVCATSGGIFTPEAILLCSRMTQLSWQVLFWHPEIAITFFFTNRKQ